MSCERRGVMICVLQIVFFASNGVSFVQEEHSWGSGSRGQGPGSPNPGEVPAVPVGRLERTPSFTAEWEEVHMLLLKFKCTLVHLQTPMWLSATLCFFYFKIV